MNNWITVHWPPFEGQEINYNNIYIPDGREEGIEEICPGDFVFIYESKTSRAILRNNKDGSEERIKSVIGREGIVALCEVTTKLYDRGGTPDRYSDGTQIWWRWVAETKCHNRSGYVSRLNVNKVLGFSPNYTLRGFGDNNSGVKKLTKQQFENLRSIFTLSSINLTEDTANGNVGNVGNGEESEAHLKLKKAIANNPIKYLGERGLRLIKIEYPFVTNDKADIVFVDYFGKIVGVEVEVRVEDQDIAGLLQAIKYRRMLELVFNKKIGESRSVLVAYSISDKAKKLCRKYEIEAHEVQI